MEIRSLVENPELDRGASAPAPGADAERHYLPRGAGGEGVRHEALFWSNIERILDRTEVSAGADQDALTTIFGPVEIPKEPVSVGQYLARYASKIADHSINVGSPRCLGHMTGRPQEFVQLLAAAVVALNQNVVKVEASGAAAIVERQTLAIMHRLAFGLDDAFYREHAHDEGSTLGVFTSGGTLSNMTALWCARNACLPPVDGSRGAEPEGTGAASRGDDSERGVVLASSLSHYSLEKAADLLGLGPRGAIRVPVDRQGRMEVGELERILECCRERRQRAIAVVGTAGTTDCGSIDPLRAIARVALREGIHFHIDAAWCGSLLLSERRRGMIGGIEEADSVTIDGHKQFLLPIGSSVLLWRDPRAARAIEHRANYMLRQGSGDLGVASIEGSRPASSLLLHAVLHVLGPKGFSHLIEDNLEKTRLLAGLIERSEEFELLLPPETNIVLYRYVPDALRRRVGAGEVGERENAELNDLNERIQTAQFLAGRTYTSRTALDCLPRYRGRRVVALRAVVSNPRTTENDLREVLEDQSSIARALGNPLVLEGLER